MGRNKGKPMISTSVRLSPEFHDLMVEHNISFSEAIRVGASLMFAELGISEYDNNLNIIRKINLIRQQLEEKSNELEELKKKVNKK